MKNPNSAQCINAVDFDPKPSWEVAQWLIQNREDLSEDMLYDIRDHSASVPDNTERFISNQCLINLGINLNYPTFREGMINNLLTQFEGVGFKTYHLEVNEKDTIVTIHEDSEETYKIFIENIKEILKDIKLYIDKNYKKNRLFNALMLNLWQNFYQKYIDILADICYGYAITTHKSQGSNYKVVFVDMELKRH